MAQLEEHLTGSQGVTGSSPVSSTNKTDFSVIKRNQLCLKKKRNPEIFSRSLSK